MRCTKAERKRRRDAFLNALAGVLRRGTGGGTLSPFKPPKPLRNGKPLSQMVLEDRRR